MCDGIRSKMREKEDESGKCTSGSSSAALVGGGEKHGTSTRSILLSGVPEQSCSGLTESPEKMELTDIDEKLVPCHRLGKSIKASSALTFTNHEQKKKKKFLETWQNS